VVAGVSRWWQEFPPATPLRVANLNPPWGFLLSPDTVAVRRELLTAQEKVF